MSDNIGKLHTSIQTVLAHIDALVHRFEKAERSIDSDIEEIEKCLQQLIELVKTVSTIQEQVGTQQKVINALRIEVRDQLSALEVLMNSGSEQYSDSIAVISKKITDAIDRQSRVHHLLETRVTSLETRLQTWLNRSIGGWIVIALTCGIFQYIALRYINSFNGERAAATAAIERIDALESRQIMLERRLNQKAATPPKPPPDYK